jgi:hypothetical protein
MIWSGADLTGADWTWGRFNLLPMIHVSELAFSIGRVHNSPDGNYWYIYLPMAYHQHQWLPLVLSISNQFCRQTTVKLELPTRAFHKTKWWPQVLKEEFEDTNSIQFNSKLYFRVDINHTYNTSSSEVLKSTMVYNNTYNHAYKHIK